MENFESDQPNIENPKRKMNGKREQLFVEFPCVRLDGKGFTYVASVYP